jgi:hypothetical protein
MELNHQTISIFPWKRFFGSKRRIVEITYRGASSFKFFI